MWVVLLSIWVSNNEQGYATTLKKTLNYAWGTPHRIPVHFRTRLSILTTSLSGGHLKKDEGHQFMCPTLIRKTNPSAKPFMTHYSGSIHFITTQSYLWKQWQSTRVHSYIKSPYKSSKQSLTKSKIPIAGDPMWIGVPFSSILAEGQLWIQKVS